MRSETKLAPQETRQDTKTIALERDYRSIVQSIDNGINFDHVAHRIRTAISIAREIAGNKSVPEEKYYWIANAYQLNKQGFLLATQANDIDSSDLFFYSMIYRAKDLVGITDDASRYGGEEGNVLAEQSYAILNEAAEFATEYRDFRIAADFYILSSDIADRIAQSTSDMGRKYSWFVSSYEQRIKPSELDLTNSYVVARAALGLEIAGKTAQSIATLDMVGNGKTWLQKGNEAKCGAGELWAFINEPEKSQRSFEMAEKIAIRMRQ